MKLESDIPGSPSRWLVGQSVGLFASKKVHESNYVDGFSQIAVKVGSYDKSGNTSGT